MADINQEARIPVYINDEQAKSALKNLTEEAEKWRKKMFEAMAGGDLKGLKEAERELKIINGQMNSIKKEAFDVNKVLQNISTASSKDLKKALAAVNKEMEGLNRSSKEYQALMTKKNAIKDEFSKINGVVKEQEGFFSKLANGANKYFNVIALGIATITGVAFSVGQFIKGMVGLDDSLADVQKTTGLTRTEVREMYQDFRYFNTRTPRKELLALAEEAGRLGRTGKKDIMDFVEVANKIKISLGDDLGGNAEEAIKEVGKLTEIYRIGQQYGVDFKTSMEKVGSGLNEVANNSNASAGYLIEYLKRLGGISVQAKISAADIMGYASTFDQLGQNVEMAATAQSKIIIDMFTDPAKYAHIAGMEVRAFSNLLNTDANEAFIKFLDGLNGNNEGLSTMATKLDDLDIDGDRAVRALASLSSNTKMLRDQQILANDSMREGTSLQNEYTIKNNNLAGSWEKLTVFINSKFINSGFIGFLETVIGKTAEWIAQPVSKKLREEQTEVNGLVVQLQSANLKEDERLGLIKKLNELAPDLAKSITEEKINIEDLTEALSKYNDEMALKILIAEGDEDIARQKAKVESYKNLSLEAEAELAKGMKSSIDWFSKQGPAVRKQAEEILYDTQKSIMQKGEALNSLALKVTSLGNSTLFQSLNDYRIFKKGYSENLFDLNILITKTKSTSDEWARIFGSKNAGGSPVPPPPPPPPPPPVPGLSNDELKKASDKALEGVEAANNARMTLLNTQYEAEKWSEKRFKEEQLDMELVFLVQKKAILTLNNQNTNDVDKQMNDNRLEALKNRNSMMLEEEKSFRKQMDENDKEFLKQSEDNSQTEDAILKNSIDAITDSIKDSTDSMGDAKDKEKALLEERARNYQMISGTIVSSLSDMISGSLDEYATYGDALILMSLQILKQMAPIWAAQIVGGSLATPDSILTGGIAGVAKFTAMLAIMEGFIGLAENGVKKGIEKKKEAANKSGYLAGGHTGPGSKYDVAGIVHAGEYVIPQDGVNNVQLCPVIDLIEIARRNGSLARLDLRPVVASISARNQGYASGGHAGSSPSSQPNTTSVPDYIGLDAATANRLADAVEKLTQWKPSVDVETIDRKMTAYKKTVNSGLK